VKTSRSVKIAAAFAVAALALAGMNVSAAQAAGSKKIYVLGGGDAFFAVVKNGYSAATKAVKAAGWTPVWLGLKNYDNIGPDMVKLIRTAVAQHAAAIALPDWNPSAENPEIKKAIAKGIKVVLYNAGIDEITNTGALTYTGSDEYQAGLAGGKYMASKGAKNLICVNTNPGQTNLEARCKGLADGMKSGGGKGTALELPATSFGNATAVSNAIKGELAKDSTIDAVFCIAQGDADAAASAIAAAGSKAKLGNFDLSTNVLNRIKAGKETVAIDQQGWLEGYNALSIAWYAAAYGIVPAVNYLTGPALVTSANVAKVVSGVKTGQR